MVDGKEKTAQTAWTVYAVFKSRNNFTVSVFFGSVRLLIGMVRRAHQRA